MNEAETHAERIDPKLKACGWGVDEGSKILWQVGVLWGEACDFPDLFCLLFCSMIKKQVVFGGQSPEGSCL
jgi:hypothetical protein